MTIGALEEITVDDALACHIAIDHYFYRQAPLPCGR
jgi:hypothetical protein